MTLPDSCAAGIQVAIGGFHVSGCLAMLPGCRRPARAQELGICLFAGEAEGRLDDLLRDSDAGSSAALQLHEGSSRSGDAAAAVPAAQQRAALSRSRGQLRRRAQLPFSCSFCTIINVQGRKSRYRTADDVESLIRANAAHGIKSFFITDDNFARNKNWEAILDRIIMLRHEQGMKIHLNMQVDTCCHKIPNFVAKAARAGCTKVFIGLETSIPTTSRALRRGRIRSPSIAPCCRRGARYGC